MLLSTFGGNLLSPSKGTPLVLCTQFWFLFLVTSNIRYARLDSVLWSILWRKRWCPPLIGTNSWRLLKQLLSSVPQVCTMCHQLLNWCMHSYALEWIMVTLKCRDDLSATYILHCPEKDRCTTCTPMPEVQRGQSDETRELQLIKTQHMRVLTHLHTHLHTHTHTHATHAYTHDTDVMHANNSSHKMV